MVLLISCILQTAGQTSYYYCQGQKIPLTLVTNKVVITTKGHDKNVIKESSDIRLIRRLNDKHNTVGVYKIRIGSLGSITSVNLPSSAVLDPCYTDMAGKELSPTGYMNIQLKKSEDITILQQVARQYNLIIEEQDPFMPLWYLIRRGDNCKKETLEITNEIYESRKFASCSPEFWFEWLDTSYDPLSYGQWGLNNPAENDVDISVSPAWDYSTGRGIKIAIIDLGVDLNHEDLIPNIYMSYDCMTNSSPSKLYGSHGTKCAGVAAAVRNNGKGITGVAPDAKLMIASIDTTAPNLYCRLAMGIEWAVKNGADILSCSWSANINDKLISAFNKAVKDGRNGSGCIIVTSAGNNGAAITYPGDDRKEILVVGSIDKNGYRRSDCCYGEDLFVMAPGDYIYTTFPRNEYNDEFHGTSAACPHVAGVVALILERNPALKASEVRNILGSNTKKVGDKTYDTEKEFGKWNQWYGYGLIDAYKAVISTPRE